MASRIPARIEAMGLIRAVQSAGGFGTVLHRGEPDAGALLVVLVEHGRAGRVFERMPQLDGTRAWHCAREEDAQAPGAFGDYLFRRAEQDRDLWVIELDIARGERFIL